MYKSVLWSNYFNESFELVQISINDLFVNFHSIAADFQAWSAEKYPKPFKNQPTDQSGRPDFFSS